MYQNTKNKNKNTMINQPQMWVLLSAEIRQLEQLPLVFCQCLLLTREVEIGEEDSVRKRAKE